MDVSFNEEDLSGFRARCSTWPMQNYSHPHIKTAESSGIGTPTSTVSHPSTLSLSSSVYPSSDCLNSSWTQLASSVEFTDSYSVTPNEGDLKTEKRRRIRRRDPDMSMQKKSNPWGEESYADLIARALESVPDGRLRLNEIYQWFIERVTYFGERAGPEEAAGWKVSRSPFTKFTISLVFYEMFLFRILFGTTCHCTIGS